MCIFETIVKQALNRIHKNAGRKNSCEYFLGLGL